jgi:hypothetical protein
VHLLALVGVRPLLASILLVTLSACGEGGHGGIPGDELGTYGVVGSLSGSTCGDGALGATDPWQFEVRLSRADRELFWLNGREAIAGRLEADGVSFSFETRVDVELIPAEKGRPACVISRYDRATGLLSADNTDVESFAADLRFEFAVAASDGSVGYDCSPAIGVSGGFAALPCSMGYDLEAVRTRPPEPR